MDYFKTRKRYLMNQMKITVVGGSFCPPTLAHLALAKAAGETIQADKNLLVPTPTSYINRKKKNLQFTYERLSAETRLQMLRTMVADEPHVEVDDCEVFSDKPVRTLQTLQAIQLKYPDAEIYFVIGSDKLREMNRWSTTQALLQDFHVLVTAREGEDIDQLLDGCPVLLPYRERFFRFELPGAWDDVSSTKVRGLMRRAQFEEAKQYVHPEVFTMLKEIYPTINVSDGISSFREENGFLSNFHPSAVTYGGITYTNNEAAFQAQKVLCDEEKLAFSVLPPAKAKRLGRSVQLRPDWEQVKDDLMYEIVLAKFSQNPELREKLLATGETPLYEGNTWNDCYWGVCKGQGLNKLGKILMRVRQELREV